MNKGRVVGIILIVIAVVILIVATAWLLTAGATERNASAGGQTLGFALVIIFLVLPVAAAGAYMLMQGRGESAQMDKAQRERKLLNMVLTQGKVRLDEAAIELNLTRDEVEDTVRDLVGKELFTGAINWKEGLLYSKEAAQLKADHKCPNCGGELQLAGKGVIQCPYCGSEVFMHLA